MNKKAAQEELKQLSLLEDALDKVGKKRKLNVKETEAMAAASAKYGKKSVKELRNVESAVGGVQDGVSQLTAMFKAPAKDLMSQAKEAGKYAERMKGIAAATAKSSGLLGAAGKAAGAMGVAVGGVSKLLLGWPGLVLMGMKMIIDTATKIDTYVKGLNKRFAMVRGPEVMTKDVNRQFKEFNDAVFNIGANIRDGLRTEDVQNFMEAIYTAGVRIGKLNEGFYGYRDAVHVAAKASKVLGIDMVRSGAMMGDMMTDFRMNLKDVDKAFVEVSFDAEKSGLSTDRFWGAVQNAASSLAFYGKFIENASAQMRELTKTQTMGAKEASDLVGKMGGVFRDATVQQRAAILKLAEQGGYDFAAHQEEILAGLNKQIDDIKGKIYVEGDPKAQETLKQQLVATQLLADRTAQAAKGPKGSQNKLLAEILEASQQTGNMPEILMSMLEGVLKPVGGLSIATMDLSRDSQKMVAGLKVMADKAGISETMMRELITTYQSMEKMLEGSVADLPILLDNLSNQGEGVRNSYKEFLTELGTINENTTPDAENKMVDQLKTMLGTSEEDSRRLVRAAETDDTVKGLLTKMYKKALDGEKYDEKDLNALNDSLQTNKFTLKYGKNNFKQAHSNDKKVLDAYDDTFNKITDNTLSIEDMKAIATNGAKYQFAANTGILNMSSWITKIGRKYLGSEINTEQAKALAKLREAPVAGQAMKAIPLMDTIKEIDEMPAKLKSAIGDSSTASERQRANDLKRLSRKKVLTPFESLQLKTLRSIDDNDTEDMINQKIGIQLKAGQKERDEKRKEAVTQLENLKKSTADLDIIADLLQAQDLASDPKKQEELFNALKKEYAIKGAKEVNVDELLSEMPKKQAEVMKKYIESGAGGPVKKTKKMRGTGEFRSYEEQLSVPTTPTTVPTTVATKQGLQKPEMVTHKGPVVLHPKETILPASLGGFQTKPMIMGENPPALGGGNAGAKAITINVNATERDLAQKIANEVRGVLYREQVNNQG
jgi:hypothetical protein